MGQLQEADVTKATRVFGGAHTALPGHHLPYRRLPAYPRINARQSARIRLRYARLSRSVGAQTDPEGGLGLIG